MSDTERAQQVIDEWLEERAGITDLRTSRLEALMTLAFAAVRRDAQGGKRIKMKKLCATCGHPYSTHYRLSTHGKTQKLEGPCNFCRYDCKKFVPIEQTV